MLVFKKCRENSDDVLFIDACAHFNPPNRGFNKSKNQNTLTPRGRNEAEKYSQLAPLSEIEESDDNLNIPRYVHTFEEEEPVDLAAVTQELKQLNADMGALDEAIHGYCDELGIEAPV